jgi:hypothetical protein
MTPRKWNLTLLLVLTLAGRVSGGLTVQAEEPALRSVIDTQIAAAWDREKITPAGLADDATFLRRVYFDLVGTIPTYEETVAFLDNNEPAKREVLVDRLLADPRFAQHQADIWDLILFTRNPPGYETDKRAGIQKWLTAQFAENVPYDKWVGQLLRAEGNSAENGPPLYLVQYRRQPEDAAEAITQTFLGVQLQCARCHNHPFESWTQLDFYGMAAFLARLEVVNVGKHEGLTKFMVGEKNTGDVLFSGPASQQEPGKKGQPVKPKFLHGEPLEEPAVDASIKEERFTDGKIPPAPTFSRKDKLADWIAGADNPYFAKAAANRIWSQFMGRGLVHPVDNMSPANKPSHPELLETLARSLVDHKFDLKWYIRELCLSRTYQMAASGETTEAEPPWFQRARVRPLSAEEMLESWRVATGYDAVVQASGKTPPKERFHGVTWGYMLSFFGQPANGVGDFQGGLHEHLYLNNGELNRLFVREKGGLYETLLNSTVPWDQRVERLYLTVLNRRPSDEERQKFVAYLSVEDKPTDRWHEAMWALLTCSEYRFNH